MSDTVAPSKFTQFALRADEIQSRCACRRWSPRECFTARYGRVHLDDFTAEYDEYDDGECECVCHFEIDDLETEIWGERDE